MQTGALLHELTSVIARAEASGISTQELCAMIGPARGVIARSPFAARMQTWPRGYPGDFETVEWMADQRSRTAPGSIADLIERHCLASPACQQHRNKLRYQADLIRRIAERKREARILIVACGSALDVEAVKDSRAARRARFVLNDVDVEALTVARRRLRMFSRCEFIEGNALTLASQLGACPSFDLVITGGLFDYLPDRAARFLVRLSIERWLAPGGVLYFSNIVRGHPYRHWMQYLGDWALIERDEVEAADLLRPFADTPRLRAVKVRREGTGLALLVTALLSRDPASRADAND